MSDIKYAILILGMGNPLMSDDGLGVSVAEALKQKQWPPEVLVLEIGTSAMYYLEEISRSRHLIAVDAVRAGGKPGSIYRLTAENILCSPDSCRDVHNLSLPGVIGLARETKGFPANFIVYGVEPLNLSFGCQFSPEVKKALPKVIKEVEKEISKLMSDLAKNRQQPVLLTDI